MRRLALGAFAVAALAGPVSAQMMGAVPGNQSEYTDIDLDACTVVTADDFGATFACPGYRGIPVMLMESDLRFYVSFGLRSLDKRAANQTLIPFNYLGSTIEWRMSNANGGWKPFATIVRYIVSSDTGTEHGEVLVVTSLESGNTCHVAYIDARANPDANEMARTAADEKAVEFDCATGEPEIIGEFSAW